MATFAPRLASQQVDRVARLQTMMDMPFTLTRNLGEQAQQGVLDSFGLGTVIREGSIPAGNTVPTAEPRLFPNPAEPLGRLAQNVGGMIRGDRDQPSLSEEEYKASPYFRSDIPFEQGMTEDRAAALAMFYDTKKVREYFGQKRPFSTFIGQFAGQALDPINYVPVFGQAAEAAAVARIGTIAGRAVLGSADAAINTAAFGLLTSGLREEFGDDTSWQAMTSEIAMSALIGGAFGGVSGVISNAVTTARGRVDRQLEAAVADALTDLRGVKESRAVLNEAIGDMAAGRDVNLSPNGQAAIERIQTQAMNTASTARALDVQTANIPEGAKVAITPAGSRVEIRPEVVDLDSLVNASGALQVRNRSSQASAAQVEQIATALDPARLMTSVDADSGAPIVGPDNVVDSGNGRVLAIRRAYEAYPERAGAYRKALETAGYDLTGISNPVLISRRVTQLSEDARAKFNEEANAPRAAQMSAVELAAMDRNALEGTLDVLDASPITSAANRAFVQRFLGNLVPSARGALIDPSGAINADGVRRIENALVAAAYGDVDAGVLRRFAEATDDNTRSIVGAMADVAGKWAGMRQAIKAGDISPEFDMTRELTDALRMIGQWREKASKESRPVSVVIREGMAQLDLLSGEVSPETQAIISAFYTSNSFARAAGRETIAEFLSRIVDAAEELGRPQLFGEAGVGRMEVLRNAAVNEQGNLFTPVGTVDGIEADGGFSRTVEAAANREGDRPATGQGRRAAAIADEPAADFPIGAGQQFRFLRNTVPPAADTPRTFGQDVEPAGRYMNYDEMPNGATREGWERGQATFERPLFLRVGSDDYASPDNWKRRLSTAYDGLTGEALSRALAADGIDGIVTFDKYGASEIVDLGSFRAANDDGLTTPSIGEPVAMRNLSPEGQAKAQADYIASQPARSLDDLYAVAQGHQDELGEIGAALGAETGAEFRNPGLKGKETSAEKMERKRYDSTSRLTDVVRAGYVVNAPGQVDDIIAGLAQRFRVLDEGWRMTEAGYFDRKAMVQFADGTIGEVQFWHPDLLAKKDGQGHALYEEMRTTADPVRKMELLNAQRRIYLESLDTISDEWLPIVDQLLDEVSADVAAMSGRPTPGNMRSNMSSDTARPESTTSANSTGSQPSGDRLAQARPSDVIAGRPSQSMNVTDGAPDVSPTVGTKSLTVNDAAAAAGRVGKDETLRDIALSHGVDPVTGGFVEQGDIAQIREEGRLTAEDEAVLADADQMFLDAEAYGRALDAAVRCVI